MRLGWWDKPRCGSLSSATTPTPWLARKSSCKKPRWILASSLSLAVFFHGDSSVSVQDRRVVESQARQANENENENGQSQIPRPAGESLQNRGWTQGRVQLSLLRHTALRECDGEKGEKMREKREKKT